MIFHTTISKNNFNVGMLVKVLPTARLEQINYAYESTVMDGSRQYWRHNGYSVAESILDLDPLTTITNKAEIKQLLCNKVYRIIPMPTT